MGTEERQRIIRKQGSDPAEAQTSQDAEDSKEKLAEDEAAREGAPPADDSPSDDSPTPRR
jgi:hypothetical protein